MADDVDFPLLQEAKTLSDKILSSDPSVAGKTMLDVGRMIRQATSQQINLPLIIPSS